MGLGREVGNDVVDLGDPETTEVVVDGGFAERICTTTERARLRAAAGDARLVLWQLWSAKESAYKIGQRRTWELPFRHARYEVDHDAGVVRHGVDVIPIRWQLIGGALVCLALPGGDFENAWTALAAAADLATPAGALTRRERASVSSTSSFAVRVLAKQLLVDRLGVPWNDLEIVRPERDPASRRAFGPPEVWFNEAPVSSLALSLSHHGRYVACAATHRFEGDEREPGRVCPILA